MINPSSARDHKRNLETPNNLMIIMSTNGKEDAKTLDNTFEYYFGEKTN